jgi:hypothetical protein
MDQIQGLGRIGLISPACADCSPGPRCLLNGSPSLLKQQEITIDNFTVIMVVLLS